MNELYLCMYKLKAYLIFKEDDASTSSSFLQKSKSIKVNYMQVLTFMIAMHACNVERTCSSPPKNSKEDRSVPWKIRKGFTNTI